MILPNVDWVYYDLDKGVYILNDPEGYLLTNTGARLIEAVINKNSPLASGSGLNLENTSVSLKNNNLIYTLQVNTSQRAELLLSGVVIENAFGVSSGGGGSFLPLSGGTLSGFLTLHSDPTASGHAATKQYVDTRDVAVSGAYVAADTALSGALNTLINARVAKAGDTMTGFLTLHSDPTASGHAATKQYVDTAVASISGGGGSGSLSGVVTITGTQTVSGEKSFLNLKANSITNINTDFTVTVTGNNSLIVSVSGLQILKVGVDGRLYLSSDGNFNIGTVVLTESASTTAITTINLWNFPIETNSMYRFELSTDSITRDGTHRARSKEMIATYYRKAGAPIRVSTQSTPRDVSDVGTNMDVFFTISGNNILVQAQSTAVQNVSWIAKMQYQKITW